MQTPPLSIPFTGSDDDDDFQIPSRPIPSSLPPTCPSSSSRRPKRQKPTPAPGKENAMVGVPQPRGLDSLESWGGKNGYFVNSIESRLLAGGVAARSAVAEEVGDEDFELGTQLDELIGLCSEDCVEEGEDGDSVVSEEADLGECVECPLCGLDISDMSENLRLIHTNECLDRDQDPKMLAVQVEVKAKVSQRTEATAMVVDWLRTLGLSKYEEAFVKEEIDWESLKCLNEEDLLGMGMKALGPRKKVMIAIDQLKTGITPDVGRSTTAIKIRAEEGKKCLTSGNKLITEFFQVPGGSRVRSPRPLALHHGLKESTSESRHRKVPARARLYGGKYQDIPPWCVIPGTPFRVDAFRFLRGGCTHWFLTHFHADHYQGLTRSFCHGKIYCSPVTASLVNAKIGISWDKLLVLPMNEKTIIAGISVTFLDANHCPGSVMILFELPDKKAILHTGDFRFCEEMVVNSVLSSCPINTLILDTTYCNPEYDFPKQEAVIQFVLEAIQAEAFNPKTLFLIGTYTIGKERLFLEVARFLRKKIYVGAAKLRVLKCLGIPNEEMQLFSTNEKECNIHLVPLWSISSFKRMKHLSTRFMGQYNQIVAFSPTGWSYGKGKKKTPGRRWQQGTIIRYEVPYSEHSSFTELKEFVRALSPEKIIPSVNNRGPESSTAMIALLTSEYRTHV